MLIISLKIQAVLMVTCDIVIGLAVRILDYAKQPKTALALAHFL